MDTQVRIMASSKADSIVIIEVDYVQLLLFFRIIFLGVNLESLENQIILRRFLDFKDLMQLATM